jgi:hypothetical protein
MGLLKNVKAKDKVSTSKEGNKVNTYTDLYTQTEDKEGNLHRLHNIRIIAILCVY